jgi:hypothetical protein
MMLMQLLQQQQQLINGMQTPNSNSSLYGQGFHGAA